MKYVVGFAFTPDGRVLLVEKKRPTWQKGLLNGIGGQIEGDELPFMAMKREAEEEAGLGALIWKRRGLMRGTNNDGQPFECHIFYAESPSVEEFEQREDEVLGLYDPATSLQGKAVVSNLQFLIPFHSCGDQASFMTLDY